MEKMCIINTSLDLIKCNSQYYIEEEAEEIGINRNEILKRDVVTQIWHNYRDETRSGLTSRS